MDAVDAVGEPDVPPKLLKAFGVAFFTLIFLQKLGYAVDLAQVVLYGCFFWLAGNGHFSVNLVRLISFCAFLAVALLSQLISQSPFSPLSIFFLISLYLPFVFEWHVSRQGWVRVISIFQDMMIVPAAMVFIQIGYQLVTHWRVLSMNSFVPHQLLLEGFNYEAPVHWGQPLMRPNGFFMLEPSFVSAFCASALILETAQFRRIWRMVLYGAAVVASTGVTGLVLLAVATPILLARQRPVVIVSTLVIGGLALAGVFASGSADFLTGRVSELGSQSSSGFGRLIAPLIELGQLVADPHYLVTGVGAGNEKAWEAMDSSAWPVVKLSSEYGFLTCIAFYVFFTPCFFRSPEPSLAAGLFFVYSFTGAYLLSPILPILAILTVTSLRIEQAPNRPGEQALDGTESLSTIVSG